METTERCAAIEVQDSDLFVSSPRHSCGGHHVASRRIRNPTPLSLHRDEIAGCENSLTNDRQHYTPTTDRSLHCLWDVSAAGDVLPGEEEAWGITDTAGDGCATPATGTGMGPAGRRRYWEVSTEAVEGETAAAGEEVDEGRLVHVVLPACRHKGSRRHMCGVWTTGGRF